MSLVNFLHDTINLLKINILYNHIRRLFWDLKNPISSSSYTWRKNRFIPGVRTDCDWAAAPRRQFWPPDWLPVSPLEPLGGPRCCKIFCTSPSVGVSAQIVVLPSMQLFSAICALFASSRVEYLHRAIPWLRYRWKASNGPCCMHNVRSVGPSICWKYTRLKYLLINCAHSGLTCAVRFLSKIQVDDHVAAPLFQPAPPPPAEWEDHPLASSLAPADFKPGGPTRPLPSGLSHKSEGGTMLSGQGFFDSLEPPKPPWVLFGL